MRTRNRPDMKDRRVGRVSQNGPTLPGERAVDRHLLGRKSVLMGLLTSGFVIANAVQPSARASGTVKPIAAPQPAYIAKWMPSTVYLSGQQVITPNNDVVSAKAAHTSSAAYSTDATKWTLGYTYARAGLYDARRSGVVADGVTDDRAAVVAALAAAAPFGACVLLPPGITRNSGSVIPLPNGSGIVGHGREVTTWDGPGFSTGDSNLVSRIRFDGSNAANSNAVSSRFDVSHKDTAILDNAFCSWTAPAIYLVQSADNGGPSNYAVKGNTFRDSGNAIFLERVSNCEVSGNSSENPVGVGQHIVMYAANGCQILGNKTVGGITGILGLAARGLGAPIRNNIISGNRVVSPSEEGISLDINGNSATSVGAVDWGTIREKNFTGGANLLTLTLDGAFSSSPLNRFYGQVLTVTTGSAAGTMLPIGESNGALFYSRGVRPSVYSAINVGDEVVIGYPLSGNIITGNSVENAGTYSIVLWGLCIGNVITENTCSTNLSTSAPTSGPSGGVEVWGLDGLIVSTGSQTGRAGRAPSIKNRVSSNSLTGADLKLAVQRYGTSPGYPILGLNTYADNLLCNADIVSS